MVSYSLVTLHQGEPVTGSDIIAEQTQHPHASVIKLIRNHQQDLEEFGPCGFEIHVVNRPQGGGAKREVALLNEPQATLLLTYMRNNDVVRGFKKALVKAFFELRATVRQPQAVADNMLTISKDHYIQLLENQVALLQQQVPATKPKRTANKWVDDIEKANIRRLAEYGLSLKEIANRTGRSTATISFLTRDIREGKA
jgi:phage regulator Rha-like protein